MNWMLARLELGRVDNIACPVVVDGADSRMSRMWANAQRGGRPADHRWRGALCSMPQSLADAHYLTVVQ